MVVSTSNMVKTINMGDKTQTTLLDHYVK